MLALALGVIAAAWYFSSASTETVPNVAGLALDAAVSRLQDDGFKTDIASEPNDATEGTVFRQSPERRHRGRQGLHGAALASKGAEEVTVPTRSASARRMPATGSPPSG